MEPLKLSAVTKNIIWGGERLAREYGKGTPGEKLAESWELTSRADGINYIHGGSYDGMLLSDYLAAHKQEVFYGWDGKRFPLLIKLIDAEADLSIQVHPDDGYAALHTNDLGKTEMWYIVDAIPGAHLVYGFKEPYTAEQIRAAIQEGTLESLLNYVPVHKGETYFIPSGMVHAICHGILIAEIQQNSNITYRVYDYNRRGADGSLRALHIEDALAVFAKIPKPLEKTAETDVETGLLAGCGFFRVYRYNGAFSREIKHDSFCHLLCINGATTLTYADGTLAIGKGESIFLPAGLGNIIVGDGAEIIASSVK